MEKNYDPASFEAGARTMRKWVEEMLTRYGDQAAARSQHEQACAFYYGSTKTAELPVQMKALLEAHTME
jgi:hypothetical protein